MKKKNILLAILCASILLFVPLTNVSGGSIGGLNTKVEIVEDSDLNHIEQLLDDLRVLIDEILLVYGNNPKIVEKCLQIKEFFDSWKEALCFALFMISIGVLGLAMDLPNGELRNRVVAIGLVLFGATWILCDILLNGNSFKQDSILNQIENNNFDCPCMYE